MSLDYRVKHWFKDDLFILPDMSPSYWMPVGAVGTLNLGRVYPHSIIHDAGCGIALAVYNQEITRERLEVVRTVFDEEYFDEELEALLPSPRPSFLSKANQSYAKVWDDSDYEQRITSYYSEATNEWAIAFHWSRHESADSVLQYCLDKYYTSTSVPSHAEEVVRLAKVCQEYSIRSRRWYFDKLDEAMGISRAYLIDSPHVSIDENNVFRCGVQRATAEDYPIYRVEDKIYLYQGLGNADWLNSTYGVLPEKFELEAFSEKVKNTAVLVNTFTKVPPLEHTMSETGVVTPDVEGSEEVVLEEVTE